MAKKTLMNEEPKNTPPASESTALVASPGAALLAGQAGTAIDVDRSEFSGSPYVVFASTRSPVWPRISLAIRDAQEGDPVLIPPEPLLPIRLSPFKFLLLAANTYYCSVDNQGQIVKASRTKSAECNKCHVATVLLVFTPGGLVPATCTFKTTKSGAAERAAQALELAGKPTWPTLSPAHNATLVAKLPWQRFTTTVRLKPGVGRGTGMAYIAANGVIEPADISVWAMIQEFEEDKERMKALDAVVNNHNRRLEDITALYA